MGLPFTIVTSRSSPTGHRTFDRCARVRYDADMRPGQIRRENHEGHEEHEETGMTADDIDDTHRWDLRSPE